MPPSMPKSSGADSYHDALAVVVTDQWVDQLCEHVGSLCAVLRALSHLEGTDRPPAMVLEGIEDCTSLQDLLNAIPVWGGRVVSATEVRTAITAGRIANPDLLDTSDSAESAPGDVSAFGDSFPEISADPMDSLPTVDKVRLEERCAHDVDFMLSLLQKFRFRAEGDLRELELLSVGHDWTRLSRLAGVLKDAANQVSAYRIVVDAAALQGAARIGCRNDVDLALDALRTDLQDCAQQVAEWQTSSCVAD